MKNTNTMTTAQANKQYSSVCDMIRAYGKATAQEEVAESIKKSFSPNDARNIAHENKEYRLSNWSDVKYQNMERVLRLKMEQNPIVKDVLLNTKDYIIAENCIDEDTDWGLDNNNQGNNYLGKIWMKIREDIKGGNTHE